MNDSLSIFLDFLARVDRAVNYQFTTENDRSVELADKQQKIIEELGEVIQAWKHGEGKAHILDEISDTTIAALTQAFILGYSPTEIMDSLARTCDKLAGRWNIRKITK